MGLLKKSAEEIAEENDKKRKKELYKKNKKNILRVLAGVALAFLIFSGIYIYQYPKETTDQKLLLFNICFGYYIACLLFLLYLWAQEINKDPRLISRQKYKDSNQGAKGL